MQVVIYSRIGEVTKPARDALTAGEISFKEVRTLDGNVRADDLSREVARNYTTDEMKDLLREIAISIKKIEAVIL